MKTSKNFLGKWKLDNIIFESDYSDNDNDDTYDVTVNGKPYAAYINEEELKTIFYAMSYERNIVKIK